MHPDTPQFLLVSEAYNRGSDVLDDHVLLPDKKTKRYSAKALREWAGFHSAHSDYPASLVNVRDTSVLEATMNRMGAEYAGSAGGHLFFDVDGHRIEVNPWGIQYVGQVKNIGEGFARRAEPKKGHPNPVRFDRSATGKPISKVWVDPVEFRKREAEFDAAMEADDGETLQRLTYEMINHDRRVKDLGRLDVMVNQGDASNDALWEYVRGIKAEADAMTGGEAVEMRGRAVNYGREYDQRKVILGPDASLTSLSDIATQQEHQKRSGRRTRPTGPILSVAELREKATELGIGLSQPHSRVTMEEALQIIDALDRSECDRNTLRRRAANIAFHDPESVRKHFQHVQFERDSQERTDRLAEFVQGLAGPDVGATHDAPTGEEESTSGYIVPTSEQDADWHYQREFAAAKAEGASDEAANRAAMSAFKDTPPQAWTVRSQQDDELGFTYEVRKRFNGGYSVQTIRTATGEVVEVSGKEYKTLGGATRYLNRHKDMLQRSAKPENRPAPAPPEVIPMGTLDDAGEDEVSIRNPDELAEAVVDAVPMVGASSPVEAVVELVTEEGAGPISVEIVPADFAPAVEAAVSVSGDVLLDIEPEPEKPKKRKGRKRKKSRADIIAAATGKALGSTPKRKKTSKRHPFLTRAESRRR